MVSCINCHSKKFYPTSYFTDNKGNEDLIKCSSCGLVRLRNFKAQYDDKLYDFYSNFSEISKTKNWQKKEKINFKSFKDLLAKLSLKINKKKLYHLDFGSGLGLCLDASRELGIDCMGVELNKFCFDICKNKKHKIVKDLSSLDKDQKFDIITLSEVIEHLPNPEEILRTLKSRLSEEGCLYISCPNWNSLERFLFQNKWSVIHKVHYHYFTKKTILILLRKAKFNHIEINTKNFHPFKLKKKQKLAINKKKLNSEVKLKSFTTKSMFLFLKKPSLYLKKPLLYLISFLNIGSSFQIFCRKF